MLQYNEKTKFRKRLYSLPVFALLLVLAIVVVRGTLSIYGKMAESKQNLEKVTEEAAVLESRQQALNSDVEKLKTPEGVEEEVRKKFSVVKDGEQMVVLLDDKTASSAPPQPKPGFWKRVWNIVTGGIFRGGDDASTTGTVSETGNVPAE